MLYITYLKHFILMLLFITYFEIFCNMIVTNDIISILEDQLGNHLTYYLAYFLPHLLSLFIACFRNMHKRKPMHSPPQAHGSHSLLIPIFDVSVSISLHHLLHHFCLKLHHFPIKYDNFAFPPKSRKPLKTLYF